MLDISTWKFQPSDFDWKCSAVSVIQCIFFFIVLSCASSLTRAASELSEVSMRWVLKKRSTGLFQARVQTS